MYANHIKVFVILAVGLSFLTLAAEAGELYTHSLDDTGSLGLRLDVDTREKVEGAGSLRIVSRWPTTVCLDEVTGLNIENTQLVYRARVKSDLDGQAYLEMWAHIDGQAYFSRGLNAIVVGQAGWKEIQTLFVFQRGQRPEKITLNLVINGKGTVWIDDLRLATKP